MLILAWGGPTHGEVTTWAGARDSVSGIRRANNDMSSQQRRDSICWFLRSCGTSPWLLLPNSTLAKLPPYSGIWFDAFEGKTLQDQSRNRLTAPSAFCPLWPVRPKSGPYCRPQDEREEFLWYGDWTVAPGRSWQSSLPDMQAADEELFVTRAAAQIRRNFIYVSLVNGSRISNALLRPLGVD